MQKPSKHLRTTVLVICAIATSALIYEGFRTNFSNRVFGILLPIALIGLSRMLVAFKVVELPSWFSMGFVNRAPKYPEFGKAAACFIAGLLWALISVRLVTNTPLGAAIVGVPAVLLMIAMGIFVLRGLFR
jgi:hypothetical protein